MSAIAISEKTISLDRPGGQMPVFVAEPSAEGKYPGLILVHEIFGLNDHIKDVARRFAQESYCVYAPDLFEPSGNLPDNRNDLDAMRQVWSSTKDADLIAHMQSVFNFAKTSPKTNANLIGTLGYCMGGAIALMFACRTPPIAWVVDYYGRLVYPQLSETKTMHPIDYIAQLHCPVLGLFSGCDDLIPLDQVNDFTKRLINSRQYSAVKVYENAKHAFFNNTREFYDPIAAQDAWKLTLQFMKKVTAAKEHQPA